MTVMPQERQMQALSSRADILFYGGGAGGGKRLSLDTLLPTPDGWTRMELVKDGDTLFDEQGNPTTVTKAHEIVDEHEAYRLTFDDGAMIVAGASHLWLTFDAKQLHDLTRKQPEWRARRRAKRPSRATYNRGALVAAMLSKRNSETATSTPAPTGTIRTTREIADTLRTPKGRANHAIPVAKPLALPHAELSLDPYLLGVWLGDGTHCNGTVTSADQEIEDAFVAGGFKIGARHSKPNSKAITFCVLGLRTHLRKLGVLHKNKHVPAAYMRASAEQRLALLQGLMDTDGTAGHNGKLEFTSTSKRLADAVAELISSLGSKANATTGFATLHGRITSMKYRVMWRSHQQVFRLPRKAARFKPAARRTTRFRYIVACERMPVTKMRCITVDSPSRLYLCSRDMVPTHNTFCLLLEATRHVGNPQYGGVIFRRTHPMIVQEGGLWDKSCELYPQMQARPYNNDRWVFPTGAMVRFCHMQYEKDRLGWASSQIPFIGFDEVTEFSESQFWFMLSRNRSTCGIRPYIRAACNPDSESWVARLINWWINQDTGYPIRERAGVLRWFARIDEELQWADSWAELHKQFPDRVMPPDMPKGDHRMRPLSLTFVDASLSDNKILESKDPEYRHKLMALPLVERERLLGGNWKIRPAAGLKFPRDKWRLLPSCPTGFIRLVRYWDKAYTEGGQGAQTAGVLMGELGPDAMRLGLPRFVVLDSQKGRWGDAEREAKIQATAMLDRQQHGLVVIGIEQEGGAGKQATNVTVNGLAGFDVYSEHPTLKKHLRWNPLAAQQQVGNVGVVQGDWDWGGFIRALDLLAGDELLDKKKLKDEADAASGAFKGLAAGIMTSSTPLLCSTSETEKPLTQQELDSMPAFWKDLMVGHNQYDPRQLDDRHLNKNQRDSVYGDDD